MPSDVAQSSAQQAPRHYKFVDPSGVRRKRRRSDVIARRFVRASYRNGAEHPRVPLHPGTVASLTVELVATANNWSAGNRNRLSVSSAAFPDVTATPKRAPIGDDAVTRIATHRVPHSQDFPSYLTKPTVPQ